MDLKGEFVPTFRQALQKAVDAKGADYVYEKEDYEDQCQYRDDTGAPRCIIGYALTYMGYQLESLDEGTIASTVMRRLGVGSDTERYAANSAQESQDDGNTRGEALARYDHSMRS